MSLFFQSILMATFFLTSAQSVFALEVGETAPCVVLDQIRADGSESEFCIREANSPEHFKVLEFFSATCSACLANLPIFSALSQELKDKATFRFVGIDRSEALLRSYLATHRELIQVDLALDTERRARRAYNIIATPTLYVLNSQDVVVYKHTGVLSSKDLEKIRTIINN